MTSKYEVTKGMTFAVSDAPVTAEDFNASGFPGAGVTWLEAACATKEITFTGGQKGDIDVTTLCSTEQEQT
ncbi:phage tail protein, partial [Enterobacter hormaechei]